MKRTTTALTATFFILPLLADASDFQEVTPPLLVAASDTETREDAVNYERGIDREYKSPKAASQVSHEDGKTKATDEDAVDYERGIDRGYRREGAEVAPAPRPPVEAGKQDDVTGLERGIDRGHKFPKGSSGTASGEIKMEATDEDVVDYGKRIDRGYRREGAEVAPASRPPVEPEEEDVTNFERGITSGHKTE